MFARGPTRRDLESRIIALGAENTALGAEISALDAKNSTLDAENRTLRAARADDARRAATRTLRRVLFAVGEPDTPGSVLRSRAQAEAAARLGYDVRLVALPSIGLEAIAGIDLLVLWRAAWSPHVETMIGLVREAGGLVAFDTDDVVTRPDFAASDLIDGIRSLGFDRDECAAFYQRMRMTAAVADFCIASTDELATILRADNARAFVLPNGFSENQRRAARDAVRARRRDAARAPERDAARAPERDAARAPERDAARAPRHAPGADDRIRIGYAAGTRTHQRDARAALAALGRVLDARPRACIVLFVYDTYEILDTREFPDLARHADRIEWRQKVPIDGLPAEMARFDIAICPLEAGNPFVEAKSEIKFVDAALASVPLVASPTGPYRRTIAHGETGFLADGEDEWHDTLLALVDDEALRHRVGRAAYAAALWQFGPKRREEILDGILRRQRPGADGARAAELAIRRGAYRPDRTIALPPTTILFEHDTGAAAAVAVGITSFNYQAHLGEALASARDQSLRDLELVVVDDGSTDGSVELILDWVAAHRARFTRIRVERTDRNAGLGPARNAAFAAAEAPFVMSLDADNRLLPGCCETLLGMIERADCAFAFSRIRQFGTTTAPISDAPFDAAALEPGNYIDAMALVARWAWSAAGGYYDNPDARGWEDYDLWCRLAELGQFGVWHPEPLAEYRAHADAMTNAVTERPANKRALVAYLERMHPWLRLLARESVPRG